MSSVPADLGLHVGAGDGNRTRTISLGIRPIGASDRPDMGNRSTGAGVALPEALSSLGHEHHNAGFYRLARSPVAMPACVNVGQAGSDVPIRLGSHARSRAVPCTNSCTNPASVTCV